METNRVQRLANQYPENWSAKVAADALCKIIEGKSKPWIVRGVRQLIHQIFEHKLEHKCILDLNINVSQDRGVTCTWYQKTNRCWAYTELWNLRPNSVPAYWYPRPCTQNFFIGTSNWEQLDQAMETNRVRRLANQYPENWSAKVAADALCKIIEGKSKPWIVRGVRQLIHQSFEHKFEHKCILDLNINVSQDRGVTCTWYQKTNRCWAYTDLWNLRPNSVPAYWYPRPCTQRF